VQAEDGIRDWSVTGVQTCALPILVPSSMSMRGWPWLVALAVMGIFAWACGDDTTATPSTEAQLRSALGVPAAAPRVLILSQSSRSEERRVGKEGRTRGGAWP